MSVDGEITDCEIADGRIVRDVRDSHLQFFGDFRLESNGDISVRVDSVLKKEVENCLSDMGMSMSTAINIYLRQIVRLKAIPFIISSGAVPNRGDDGSH